MALAADLPLPEALELYRGVRRWIGTVKVGLSLFVEHGPKSVAAFQAEGAQVFLDLKLHDIPNTVELACAQAARLGPSQITVHAGGGAAMIAAARKGIAQGLPRTGSSAPKLLAVTVLTSLGDDQLKAMGFDTSAAELAERLARLACDAGADGLVCSAQEVARMRDALGGAVFLCTPGIRRTGDRADDQARTFGPAQAARAGSDLLVLGRTLYGASEPERAAEEIADEVLGSRQALR